MDFNLKIIKDELLSPGNIFWKKRSGDLVLISTKGDVINHALIEKLHNSGHEVIIENVSSQHQNKKLNAIYEKYCEELLIINKIRWREQLIEYMRIDFVVNQHSQHEFNNLAWQFFSGFSSEDAKEFIQKDSELFKRHLSITSSYTFIAFILGYYEPVFLRKLFTTTLNNLMALGESTNVLSCKEIIEYLRMQDSFNEESFLSVKEIASDDLINSTVLFERYDGSGMRNINVREMSDLEKVLVVLNRCYGVQSGTCENVFLEISRGNFNCEARLLVMLQKLLEKKEIEMLDIA